MSWDKEKNIAEKLITDQNFFIYALNSEIEMIKEETPKIYSEIDYGKILSAWGLWGRSVASKNIRYRVKEPRIDAVIFALLAFSILRNGDVSSVFSEFDVDILDPITEFEKLLDYAPDAAVTYRFCLKAGYAAMKERGANPNDYGIIFHDIRRWHSVIENIRDNSDYIGAFFEKILVGETIHWDGWFAFT